MGYFDYVEDKSNILSVELIKKYDEIIDFLYNKSENKNLVEIVKKYKNLNDKVFIYYVLYFFLEIQEKNIDFTLDERFYLILNCIDELKDIDYYLKVKKLFKIN